MKKILSVLAVMLAVVFNSVVFTSCSSSSDDIDTSSWLQVSQISGTWEEVDVTQGDYVSGTLAVEWTFNEDKSGLQYTYLSINGTKLRENRFYFTYDLGKDYIVIRSKEYPYTSKIYNLTLYGNKMILGNDKDGYFNLVYKNK